MSVLHVRGVALPAHEPVDLYIEDGVFRADPVRGAETVVAYDDDPRRNPDVLDHPARVLLRGTAVR